MNNELIIDLFCGGGGASTGIELALGRPVDIAINHDEDAIAMHTANHSGTLHYTEDIFAVNPYEAVKGRTVGLLWASPDCTHFSKAKGGKPRSGKIRSLASVVVEWAKAVRPRVIMLENVPEFKTWGPLNDNNQPDKSRLGETFNTWCGQLGDLGYQVEFRELSAADYGTPTIRTRLFMVARCDGKRIVWPEPTHGRTGNIFGLPAYRTASECIDWSIECPSIFDRKRPLAEATLKRIAKGIEKYVIHTGNPFVMKYYTGVVGSAVSEPLSTVTSIDHNALVMPFLAKYHGQKCNESRCYGAGDPLMTVDTQNRFGLVSAFLTKFYNTNIGSDMRKPMPTITATGQHIGEVRAFLIKYYGQGVGQSLKEPLHTIVSKDRFGLVTVAGEQYQIADIGLRMLSPRELARAQGFPDDYILTGTKTSQVHKIGNSVCPPIARAIVAANYKPKTERMVG